MYRLPKNDNVVIVTVHLYSNLYVACLAIARVTGHSNTVIHQFLASSRNFKLLYGSQSGSYRYISMQYRFLINLVWRKLSCILYILRRWLLYFLSQEWHDSVLASTDLGPALLCASWTLVLMISFVR